MVALIVIVVAVPLLRWLTWSEFYPQGRLPAGEILFYIDSLPPSPNPDDSIPSGWPITSATAYPVTCSNAALNMVIRWSVSHTTMGALAYYSRLFR